MSTETWSTLKSKELYGIDTWGRGYFDVNNKGSVVVCPRGESGPKVDLLELTNDLKERGIRTPMLLRFPDITKERIKLLNECFSRAINEYNYKGRYQGVYPIKVNQQRHLVEEIINFGESHSLGLECGSKPELLVVLAMLHNPKSVIICNGFKDPEYIEMAILSRKLGRNTIVVVERLEELDMILKASKNLARDLKLVYVRNCNLKAPAAGWTLVVTVPNLVSPLWKSLPPLKLLKKKTCSTVLILFISMWVRKFHLSNKLKMLLKREHKFMPNFISLALIQAI